MVLREYVDFRCFKREACPFPLLSHMAFCVSSLPGVNLASASQSAILCFVQSSYKEKRVYVFVLREF